MNEFPIFVYASPGEYTHPKSGGKYKVLSVASQQELDDRLTTGWHLSAADAITAAGDKAFTKSVKKPVKASKRRKPSKPIGAEKKALEPAKIEDYNNDDTSQPTREELKQKCRELGLKFANRTSDATMVQMINQALRA